ncbi:MAG TPA: dihydroorotase, partial [Bacteroidales bacterium]|nr:dihydroorotase [Bacteroidales bacterium]
MMQSFFIQKVYLVNEGSIELTNILIEDGRVSKIGDFANPENAIVIDGTGKYLLPGIIDAQVHFREPGLTHKGDFQTESRAAVAGGVTSYLDMPNTRPNVLSDSELEEKIELAKQKSLANFGFFMGVNDQNIDQICKTDTSRYFAVSDDGLYFSGKGNLLADNPETLGRLLSTCKCIVAIHSEKEKIIEENESIFSQKFGDDVPAEAHPEIRNHLACFEATKMAVQLAEKHNGRLHILHLTTEQETALFRNDIPLSEKKITTEVSVHHLWFTDKDYLRLGNRIKWNPAIKSEKDREGLFKALLDGRIDIITTDHAPHTLDEKMQPYLKSMSGAPIVQHSLNIMLEFYHRGAITIEKIVEKMCHNPAILYRISNRGFIREGYNADLVLVDLDNPYTVDKTNILYKCGWSPLEGTTFRSRVTHTFVNGCLVYENGRIFEDVKGM